MSTDQKKEKTVDVSKKEITREEKKRLRREGMEERGRLTLPDEYREIGYRYRVVNVLPGNVENAKSRGFEVVTHDMKSGSGRADQPEVNGTPLEFEVGGANGSMKAIWMRIREEDAEILDEIRDEDARAQEDMIRKNPGIPEDQLIGKVTKENLR